MRSFKKIGALVLVVAAFSAVGVANASAAEFTASSTGSLTGVATQDQVFNTGAGVIVCKKAATSGTIAATKATNQHVTVNYSECKAFNTGAPVDISAATYNFTSNGQVDIVQPITIKVTAFLIECTVTVFAQTVGTVDFATSGTGVSVTPTVTGITSTGTGGICGAHNTTGSYSGTNKVSHATSGQTVSFDN